VSLCATSLLLNSLIVTEICARVATRLRDRANRQAYNVMVM